VSIAVVTTPYDPRPKILASVKSYLSDTVKVLPETTVARSPLSAADDADAADADDVVVDDGAADAII
jgi:hypothetical protein